MQHIRMHSIQSCFPEQHSSPNSLTNSLTSRVSTPRAEETTSHPTRFSTLESKVDIDLAPDSHIHCEAASNTGPAAAAALAEPQAPHPSSFLEFRDKPFANRSMYTPLYQAALKGDWVKASEFFMLHPRALTERITKGGESVLHIAAGAKQSEFVNELVKMLQKNDLELQNKDSNTALCFAAASGITRIAEVMVEKNDQLPIIRGSNGATPLHMAALLGHRSMVWYLYSVTSNVQLRKADRVGLLIAVISSDLYDVALHILQRQPELAIERDLKGETALHVLAQKASALSGKSQLRCWQKCVYPWIHVQGYTSDKSRSKNLSIIPGIREVREKKILHLQALQFLVYLWQQILLLEDFQIGDLLRSPSRPLFVAAESGNFVFILELLRSYPDLIWKVDEQSRTIFHTAVIHRQEKIFKFIYEIGAHKDMIASYKDTEGRNMLHLAGKLAPSNRLNIVSGAALQMQRELLWFKEVENHVQPLYREMKDQEGRTPQMLFTEEHKGLVQAGEKWMKDTATSCMLVATLITTVMFAAIFTVPGGNDNETGVPIFLKNKSFVIFGISDALALFSSVTSILMFLSILTSRYAEEDFLESLPKRLIIGLATLFFSIASMLLAFSASFFIVLGRQLAWIVIPVALTACIPVTLFAFLQFPLLADMMHSTYGSGIFAPNNKDMCFTS